MVRKATGKLYRKKSAAYRAKDAQAGYNTVRKVKGGYRVSRRRKKK